MREMMDFGVGLTPTLALPRSPSPQGGGSADTASVVASFLSPFPLWGGWPRRGRVGEGPTLSGGEA